MYSVPTPLYDIHPKDFSHPSYVDQFNGHLNTGSGEPLYPPSRLPFNGMLASTFQSPHAAFYHQSPDGGLVSAFQPNGFTFDGRLAPAFQYNEMPPLSRNAPSPSSLSSSFEATLTPPGPSLGSIPQLYPELEDNLPPPPAAPRARRRRTRGPNKRPPGTGFSYLLVRLIFRLVSETSSNLKQQTPARTHRRRSSRWKSELPWKSIIPTVPVAARGRLLRGARIALRGKSTSFRTTTARD